MTVRPHPLHMCVWLKSAKKTFPSLPYLQMMSDYEEDLDDFPILSTENSGEKAESFVGAYRAESTDQWTAASGITTKMPPLFDGSTSWFKYEELIDDWLDLRALEVSKRGPVLEDRLVGDAEMHKGLLDRDPLLPLEFHWFSMDSIQFSALICVSLNHEIRRSHSALDSGSSRIFPTHSAESENT